ncbi:MAG: hypothetical protein U0165_00695 [Polyangiaceae bacterium]
MLTVAGDIEVLVVSKGWSSLRKRKVRIEREKKTEKDLGIVEKQLGNPKILEKAPTRADR